MDDDEKDYEWANRLQEKKRVTMSSSSTSQVICDPFAVNQKPVDHSFLTRHLPEATATQKHAVELSLEQLREAEKTYASLIQSHADSSPCGDSCGS